MGMDGAGRRQRPPCMLDCYRDLFLFQLLSNEVVGDNDVERGAGIFCKIIIVCFLSIRYRSYGLYYKMAGTPSSPTRFFIRVQMIILLTTKVKWNFSMLCK